MSSILPSRLWNYYNSNNFLKKNDRSSNDFEKWEEFNYYGKNLFWENKNWGLNLTNKQYESLVDLNLYPTYQKDHYDWSIKSFFEESYSIGRDKSLNEYFRFLDIYLSNNYYPESNFWNLSFKWLRDKFVENYYKQDKWMFFDIRKVYLIHIYLVKNNLLNSNIKKMSDFVFNSDNEKIKNLEYYFNNSEIFDSYEKIYVSLIGLYVSLLLKRQQKELGSHPFINRINIDNINHQWLLKLLNEARAKFNKYSQKKFSYYPALYSLILKISMDKLEKTLWKDEIFYYFNIWMEILPWVYFEKEEKWTPDEDEITL